MANNFTFQDGTPATPTVPVVTGDEDIDGLIAIRKQFIALQFQAAQNPNPTYSVHGQSFQLESYQQFLINSIAAIDKLIQSMDPYFIVSLATTG